MLGSLDHRGSPDYSSTIIESLITVVVFGLCGSVRTEGTSAVRAFLVTILCFAVLTIVWKGLGTVNENSVEVLAKWKKKERLPPHVRKFIRSTRPIRVEIGGYFYADRCMVLTLLDIITQNKLNVLLAT